MVWRLEDPQGNEAGKVKYEIVPYTRGAVLDLGCGPAKAFPHFIGVDSGKDRELFNVAMRPDVEDDCVRLEKFEDGACDAVFSSHLLEHVEDYEGALARWWQVLKVGGYLVLYLPHKDLYPNVGTFGANPDHKHDFTPKDIELAMERMATRSGTGWDLLVSEVREQEREYSFLQVYQKQAHTTTFLAYKRPKPAKTACVVRYGGFGDMLQASNILPALKRAGYHVTVMTTPKGQDILKCDPHIDAWFIQDDNQVPNHELTDFWRVQAKRFDKFVNLSESVEGTLLALPGRANHAWPDAVRRRYLDKNYLEWTSELAGIEYESEAKFYPTKEETAAVASFMGELKAVALQYVVGLGPDASMSMVAASPRIFTVLWALAGSSIHKFYPHQDAVIARVLLEMPEAFVIFTGDYACQILEAGWENEPRVRCESGKLSIRQSLALAQRCDVVVGPETGVLNAVAFEPNAKVVMLSHSSIENLTVNWTNTAALEPTTPCYPCHRLHYTRDYCFEHKETGAAMCQVSIPPDEAYEAIASAYRVWKRLKDCAYDTARADSHLAR